MINNPAHKEAVRGSLVVVILEIPIPAIIQAVIQILVIMATITTLTTEIIQTTATIPVVITITETTVIM